MKKKLDVIEEQYITHPYPEPIENMDQQIKNHNFQVHWLPGPVNQDDYFTKSFAPMVHIKQCSTYVLNHATTSTR